MIEYTAMESRNFKRNLTAGIPQWSPRQLLLRTKRYEFDPHESPEVVIASGGVYFNSDFKFDGTQEYNQLVQKVF